MGCGVDSELTPVERHGDLWLKRDDHYQRAGIRGGKVRSCWALTEGAVGLVTASARVSPQAQIVARIAQCRGIPCRLHMPTGAMTPEMEDAVAHGGVLVQHKAGYNSVICARAKEDASARKWLYVPFGMEFPRAVQATRRQVGNVPAAVQRIVIPLGSGMSAAGVLWGARDNNIKVPVLGVQIGADPSKRLNSYAPPGWRSRLRIETAEAKHYAKHVDAEIDGVKLDPHYEAKCVKYLRPGDLFWIVGIREEQ